MQTFSMILICRDVQLTGLFAPPVTPTDGSKTWGRSAVCKKEDLSSSKKKGRTWGPSSTHQKERVGGEDKYVRGLHADVLQM